MNDRRPGVPSDYLEAKRGRKPKKLNLEWSLEEWLLTLLRIGRAG